MLIGNVRYGIINKKIVGGYDVGGSFNVRLPTCCIEALVKLASSAYAALLVYFSDHIANKDYVIELPLWFF